MTGWSGFVRVDNVSYTWLGASNQNSVFVNQTAFEYTSTRSIFTMSVGGFVKMTITFLSSVTPNDLLRSSLPYSYLDIEVESEDGNQHDVQLYVRAAHRIEWLLLLTDMTRLTSLLNGSAAITRQTLSGTTA